jgi:serine/threonine protein kinase
VQTVHIAGTPGYMPPEALEGIVSSAWDMWSLGRMSEVAAGLTGDALPSNLKPLIEGCLQEDRRQRWTAEQVVKVVKPIAESSPPATQVQPQPQTPPQRIQPIPTTNTAPTVPVNLHSSPVLQQQFPRPLIPRSSPAAASHQNYQELGSVLDMWI